MRKQVGTTCDNISQFSGSEYTIPALPADFRWRYELTYLETHDSELRQLDRSVPPCCSSQPVAVAPEINDYSARSTLLDSSGIETILSSVEDTVMFTAPPTPLARVGEALAAPAPDGANSLLPAEGDDDEHPF